MIIVLWSGHWPTIFALHDFSIFALNDSDYYSISLNFKSQLGSLTVNLVVKWDYWHA